MGFWIGDSELGTEENQEECVACDGIGKALENEGKEFLTQVFVHGGQHGVEGGKSQNFF